MKARYASTTGWADDPAKSLLSQFDYLSTVSGGGYVGSWLSAWIARAGYQNVWPRLVGRRNRPDQEPSEIVWLRNRTCTDLPKYLEGHVCDCKETQRGSRPYAKVNRGMSWFDKQLEIPEELHLRQGN